MQSKIELDSFLSDNMYWGQPKIAVLQKGIYASRNFLLYLLQ